MNKSPLILPEGSTTNTGVLRGRDVRERLSGKVDPQLLTVLVTLAEINHTNVQAVAELATMQGQMLNIIQQFSDIAQNMKDRTDQMMRATEQTREGNETEQ